MPETVVVVLQDLHHGSDAAALFFGKASHVHVRDRGILEHQPNELASSLDPGQ